MNKSCKMKKIYKSSNNKTIECCAFQRMRYLIWKPEVDLENLKKFAEEKFSSYKLPRPTDISVKSRTLAYFC